MTYHCQTAQTANLTGMVKMETERLDDTWEDLMKFYRNEIPGNQEVEKMVIEDGYLTIKHRKGFDYDIALERIDSYKKIVGWIAHLNEKTWFTQDVLSCFLNIINGHFDGMIDKSR